MIIGIDRSGTFEGLRDLLQRIAAHPEVSTLIVLAGDDSDLAPELINPMLGTIPKPLYGGVFPEVVVGHEHFSRGAIVIGSRRPAHATMVRDLSDTGVPIAPQIEHALAPDAANALMLVFVDGFATRIAALVRALFEEFGVENNYIGGGAGSLSMQQKPCLFTNGGMLQDAAILLRLEWPSGIGVSHGWDVISEPLIVTSAQHTTIKTLNYEPAIDVYRRIVEPVAEEPVRADAFFDVAKAHPFGIRRLDSDVIVRDPLVLTPEGHLVCVGEVPEGAFVHILRGDAESLIAAARRAGELAQQSFPAGHTPRFRLLIDCISRSLFLGDRFTTELAAIDDGLPMVGALTIGEIANSGREFLEFYNKTAVVGLIATS
ncbi:FIST signal transduction protein [Gemmatimonas sp.]|jgi:hypothetical protein|uniref:FIST signal transduction protein n=1 Tax=Gemmatimonas sp. TaxID=1962908 RepID=UPI0037BEACC7